MESLISVIVPVYKVEKYLSRCIDSVIAQTYTNLEIILVDDGSPDSCGKICDDYAEKDNRIQVIHKNNEGLGFARNSGMAICTGEYIMFLDSDDYLALDAVQVLYERIVADCSDMAVGKHVDVYEDGHQNEEFCGWMKDEAFDAEYIFKYLEGPHYVAVSAWGKLYRRHIFEEIRYPSIKCAEDLWVFPQIVEACSRISMVDAVVYYYYQRENSIVHSKNQESYFDDTHSKLRAIRFLLDRNLTRSAQRWFLSVIDNELRLNNRKAYQEINRRYLKQNHVNKLLRIISVKQKTKWLLLQLPLSNYVFGVWLQLKNRGKNE